MKSKKGFTLVELLAVIVILSIILVIAVPNILSAITESKKNTFKIEAESYVKIAKQGYMSKLLNGEAPTETTYTYTDGELTNQTGNIPLKYSGENPESGKIIIMPDGKISMAIYNGTYCALKATDEDKILIDEKSESDCALFVFSEFQLSFGGNGTDTFNDVIAVSNGYVAVGNTNSTNISGLTLLGPSDAIIVKYNLNGSIAWQKNWGGNGSESFDSITEVSDGYIVVGVTTSTDLSGITLQGSTDAIIVKYNKDGSVAWQQDWGGNAIDSLKGVIGTSDGFVVVGNTSSTDLSGITIGAGGTDGVIVKYNSDRTMAWQKGLSSSYWGGLNGIILGSNSYTAIGMYNDGYHIKNYSSSGTVNWSGTEGTYDGLLDGILIDDGYVSVGYDENGSGSTDYAIINKYNFSGTKLWQKSLGVSSTNTLFYGITTISNKYISVGSTNATTIPGITIHGGTDAIIVIYNSDGTVESQHNYGGNNYDIFYNAASNSDGFVTVGYTKSTDINGITLQGSQDAIIFTIKY